MKKNDILKNIVTSFFSQFIVIVTGLIIPKMIISTYGSETNGLINSITQFLGYITLLELGIGPVIKAKLYKPLSSKNEEEISNIVYASEKFFKKISKIFILYVLILCMFFSFIIKTSFKDIYIILLVLAISISTFAEYYFGITYSLLLQADKKAYIINIMRILTSIISSIAIILMIKFNFKIQIVKLISSIIFIIRPIFLYYYVRKNYNIKNVNNKKYVIENKSSAFAQHIAGIIHGKTDVLVLSIFQNQLLVSVYSIYNLIVNSLEGIILSIASSIEGYFGNFIALKNEKKLNCYFSFYETIYIIIISIVYTICSIMIIPFVKLYTQGITDIEYVRPLFSIIIVTAFYVLGLKIPYNSIANTAGKFKEVRTGAIIEALLNLVISIILVKKFDLVGIAIGTLISVMYRFINLIVYVNKNILKRKIIFSIKKILLNFTTFMILNVICLKFDFLCSTFIIWILKTIILGIIVIIVYLVLNIQFIKSELLFFKKEKIKK